MIEKIQFTLYEIFGYFLPGAIALAALFIIYWSLCLPTVALPIYKIHPNLTAWAGFVGVSYLIGHLVQGIGNKFLPGAEDAALGAKGFIPAEIREAGRTRAAQLIGVAPTSVDPGSLFRFTDEYSLQKGLVGDRDIFVYREGFYKGCTISLAMLSIALFFRGIFAGTAIKMPTYIYSISRMQVFTTSILVAIATGVCKQRFHRFGAYRVSRALFAFLALYMPEDQVKKEGTGNADA